MKEKYKKYLFIYMILIALIITNSLFSAELFSTIENLYKEVQTEKGLTATVVFDV